MPGLTPFLTIMVITQALLGAAYNVAGVLAPVAAEDLGYSIAALGPYSVILAIASLAGGTMIDGIMRRYGAMRTFQVAIAMTCTGVVCPASGQAWVVVLSPVLVGFAGGMIMPCVLHLIARVTPPQRSGMVMAINQCGMPAGFGLAGVIFPWLLTMMNWRWTLLVLGVALLAVIPLMQWMRERLDSDRDPAAPLGGKAFAEPMRMAWTTPDLRLLGWLAFSFMCVQWSFVTYLVSYVKIDLQFSHAEAGSVMLVAQMTAVVSRLYFGWLLDRIGRHFLMLGAIGTCGGIAAIILGLATPQWSYTAVVASAALCAGFTMGWNAVYFAAIRKFAPEGRSGTAAGGTQIFTMVGSGVGPMIFAGILSSSGSYAAGFMVTAIFSLVMGARLLWRDYTMRTLT